LLKHWEYSISQAQRISKEEKGTIKIGLSESIAQHSCRITYSPKKILCSGSKGFFRVIESLIPFTD